jgi:glucokinase
MLEINPDSGFIIGIDVGRVSLRGCLTDLCGQILTLQKNPIDLHRDWQNLPDLVVEMIDLLKSHPAAKQAPILGVGIATVGNPYGQPAEAVNARQQMYPEALTVLPVAKIINKISMPTRIANATDAAALAETWYGIAEDENTLVYVTIGTGVKASVVVNGLLFPNQFEHTSEFGHTTIMVDGEECWCGNRGCLELYTSRQAILNSANKIIEEHPTSLLYPVLKGGQGTLAVNMIFEAYLADDSAAKQIIDNLLKYLGAGIVNLVNLYSPDLILIGTREMAIDHLEAIIPPLEKMVNERALPGSASKVKIGISSFGPNAYLMGAVTLVAQALISLDSEINFPE